MKRKIQLLVDLETDYDAFSIDESERDWFKNDILGGDLILHSNLVGDEVGTITVLKIINGDAGTAPDYTKNRIAWIKWYRRSTGCCLKDAVDEGRARYS